MASQRGDATMRLPSFADFVKDMPAGQVPEAVFYEARPQVSTDRLPSLSRPHSLGFVTPAPRPYSYSGPSSSPSSISTDTPPHRAMTATPGGSFHTFYGGSMNPVSSPSARPQYAESAPATPKSFVCAYCARVFTRRSTFLTHENTHTEANSFVCTFPVAPGVACGRGFTVPGNTYRHLRSKHGVKGGNVRDYVVRQNTNGASAMTEAVSESDEDDDLPPVSAAAAASTSASRSGGLRLSNVRRGTAPGYSQP